MSVDNQKLNARDLLRGALNVSKRRKDVRVVQEIRATLRHMSQRDRAAISSQAA